MKGGQLWEAQDWCASLTDFLQTAALGYPQVRVVLGTVPPRSPQSLPPLSFSRRLQRTPTSQLLLGLPVSPQTKDQTSTSCRQ